MAIEWDGQASLMRVTRFATADDAEERVAHGTLHELVGLVLATPPAEQAGLLIRAAGADWTAEHDLDAIRELAARPEYTGAVGAFDTADLPSDDDRAVVTDAPVPAHGPAGTPAQPPEPSETP